MIRSGRTATVLLIDDDAGSRAACRRLLESSGLEVLEAADGAAGLSLARERAPDVVVTELALRGLDGHTLLEQLAERLRGTRVIVATSDRDADARERAERAGCARFLAKPLAPETLLREVLLVIG